MNFVEAFAISLKSIVIRVMGIRWFRYEMKGVRGAGSRNVLWGLPALARRAPAKPAPGGQLDEAKEPPVSLARARRLPVSGPPLHRGSSEERPWMASGAAPGRQAGGNSFSATPHDRTSCRRTISTGKRHLSRRVPDRDLSASIRLAKVTARVPSRGAAQSRHGRVGGSIGGPQSCRRLAG